MSKGGYRGGSTIIGPGSFWAVEPLTRTEMKKAKKEWITRHKEVVARNKALHLKRKLAKKATDTFRQKRQITPSAYEIAFEAKLKDAREHYRHASKEFVVELRRSGRLVSRKRKERS